MASPVGLEFEPELTLQRYCSQAGAVAVTLTAPLWPEPGAAKIRLNAPAPAVGA